MVPSYARKNNSCKEKFSPTSQRDVGENMCVSYGGGDYAYLISRRRLAGTSQRGMPGLRKWQLCLIIEDNEVIRTEMITLLRSNGYQPVKIQPCNLFLMNVNLPGGNGDSLCLKLRQTGAFFLLPFAFPLS